MQKTKTAISLNLVSCHHCRRLWQQVGEGDVCTYCNSPLHSRKPNSYSRAWAYLIAACIMYVPANLMPVMVTQTFLSNEGSTILGGVIFFWGAGEWGLAAIVFIASFLVPLVKISTLILLLVMAQKKSLWRLQQRATLYRLLEIIGRWSMLDVFVVSILVGLVQIPGYVTITSGIGIVAFAAVVVLTMLASQSFDPRLTWDAMNNHADLEMDANEMNPNHE
jgi:paraquat-inducible protein A